MESYEIAQIILHFTPLNIPIRQPRLMQMKDDRVKMGRNMLALSKQAKDMVAIFQL